MIKMLRTISFGLLTGFVWVGNAPAGTIAPPNRPAGHVEKAASKLTLDQLFAHATLLRVRLDGGKVCEGEFKGMSGVAVNALPQILEGEVQSKIDFLKKSGTIQGFFLDPTHRESCALRCRCEQYDQVAETMGASPSPRPKVRGLSASDYLKCAKANESWICRSSLLKALIQEARALGE